MSQFALKMIALIAMLLDHAAKTVVTANAMAPFLGFELASAVHTFMLAAGRMAFPIFAWFLAEGCRRTHNLPRYLLRLLIFAVLSEISFQMCFCEKIAIGCHNVIFTLMLAALAVFAGSWLQKRGVPAAPAWLLPAAAALLLGWVLQTDYGALGVALVLGLYYIPRHRDRLVYLAAWITVYQLVFRGMSTSYTTGSLLLLYWISGMFSATFLAAYHGERGPQGKWLFYIFYPSHLLVLGVLVAVL